jgi:acyl-CoA reductase-like NAD-dependent aldehyde dehydrogenase
MPWLSSGRFLAYPNVQICIALKRILVHDKIFDKFRDAMVKYTKTLKMGEGNCCKYDL